MEITAKWCNARNYLYLHGGHLQKIDTPDMKVSLDLSTSRTSDGRRQNVRIKRYRQNESREATRLRPTHEG